MFKVNLFSIFLLFLGMKAVSKLFFFRFILINTIILNLKIRMVIFFYGFKIRMRLN
jgi:hypothetical protein